MKTFLSILFLFIISNLTIAQSLNQVQKIVPSDRMTSDKFGVYSSISGNYAIIGAFHEDEDEFGGSTMSNAGSAYIYELDAAGNWNEVQKIVASDRAPGDEYGSSVSISGNYAIVGAYLESEDETGGNPLVQSGSVYIYERDGTGNWNEVQKIVASDRDASDWFGVSVSISGDYAIIGAHCEDEDVSGMNTMSCSGSAYIFERNGTGTWNEVEKIVASDRAMNDAFGVSVSMSGTYAVVSSWGDDEDVLGGNTMIGSGSAYVYERNGTGSWNEVQKIVASDRGAGDQFANFVSISGNYLIVGAWREDEDILGGNSMIDAGSAYIFERDGAGSWNEVQKIVASDRTAGDKFGSVAISGDYALIGANNDDEDVFGGNSMSDAGSVYLFIRDGSGSWNQTQKIVASDRAVDDWFGLFISLSGNYTLIGAYQEDEDENGSNTLNNAGSAYFFKLCNSSGIDITTALVNTTITANNIIANSYQWIDCSTMSSLVNDTNQTFTPLVNGSYAVIINEKGCIDTSLCVNVTTVGINEIETATALIYPNPASSQLTIETDLKIENISILDVTGKIVNLFKSKTINIQDLYDGIYFIKIDGQNQSIIRKFVKQ